MMLKINHISKRFIKWRSEEKQFLDKYNHKNRTSREKRSTNRTMANAEPLVFDVPVVPSRITGIFQKSTNALNLTALQNLVRRLNFKNLDPPK